MNCLIDVQCEEGKIKLKITQDPHEFKELVMWYLGLSDIDKVVLTYQIIMAALRLKKKSEKEAQ